MKHFFFPSTSVSQAPEHFLSRLHPVAKLLAALLLLIASISAQKGRDLLPVVSVLLVGGILARVSIKDFFAGLRYLVVFFALVLIWPVVAFGWEQGLKMGGFSSAKILAVYATAYLLTRSCSRWELASALDSGFIPFKHLSRLSLVMVLTLGLLPVFSRSAMMLHGSFQCRGGLTGRGQRVWIRNLPLYLSASIALCLQRGERLSQALIARRFSGVLGSDGGKRPNWSLWDGVCLGITLVGFGISLFSRLYG